MRKFYRFRQNNSGGSFVIDDDVSISVYIEADNADQANAKAEYVGIYFDGCDKDIDCSCCGDRWHEADDDYSDVLEVESLKDIVDSDFKYSSFIWTKKQDTVVHTNFEGVQARMHITYSKLVKKAEDKRYLCVVHFIESNTKRVEIARYVLEKE